MPSRFFFILLAFGLIVRSIAIDRPLLDAHNIRQCHTAVLTKNLIEDGFPPLKTRGDWKGLEDSTVVLELPVQMHMAGRLAQLTGNLDMAGRITSILFWGLAFWQFWCLAFRILSPVAAKWAGVIFSLSPLSIFFGQSFQPESLVVFLTLIVLNAFLEWNETNKARWVGVMTAAFCLALTLKSNEVLHLAVPLFWVGWKSQKWRLLRRWELWLAGGCCLLTILIWSRVITHYNQESFPDWSSSAVLRDFIGTPAMRLSPAFYIKLTSYMVVLGLTPVLVIFWLKGLYLVCKTVVHPLLPSWGIGIAIYYFTFGPGGPSAHSYYHFSALPWFCLVAALGLAAALEKSSWLGRHRSAQGALVLIWIPFELVALANLYWPDRTAYEAARGLAACHPSKDEASIVAADHDVHTSGFALYPTILYYSGTRGYNLPRTDRERALDEMLHSHPELKWVVQTRGGGKDSMAWRDKLPFFSHANESLPPLDDILIARGFSKASESAAWTVFHRKAQ